MSAIFGLVQYNGRPVEQLDVEHMREPLAELGPDGGGFWIHGSVGMGQYLMCFTPEDREERQPIQSGDGQLVLVSDARIDNRSSLSEALAIAPTEAQTLPDSAFILRAYQKWGEACVLRLVGVFAFVVWDGYKRSLFAARSPFGERPLFYHRSNHRFAFATMPRGLLALPDVPHVLNESAIARFLIGEDTPNDSFYQGIARLPPAHIMVLNTEGLQVRRYWQPDLRQELHYRRDSDYAEALRELLEDVVHSQLRSITPVGIFLSGGLDSATLAAIAASQLAPRGERLAAYTEVPRAGFSGPVPANKYADETTRVRALAALYPNLDLHFVRTDGQVFLDSLAAIFEHAEVPIPSASNWLWAAEALDQAKQHGQRVLLNGAGGNLTVSWTGQAVLPDLVGRGHWRRAWHEAAAMAVERPGGRPFQTLLSRGFLPLLPPELYGRLAWLAGRPVKQVAAPWSNYSSIHPRFAARQKLNARTPNAVYPPRSSLDSRRMRYRVLIELSMAAELAVGMRGLFGVDVRTPLWDVRVVEFCLSVPEEQYQRAGVPRWLIRQTMKGRLPDEIIESRERGLQAADWLERMSDARDRIKVELEMMAADPVASRLLDIQRLRRLVEHWPSGEGNEAAILGLYRGALESGLMMGRYLRWFAGRS